jgi:squalene-hopene/tetraprenyl-beta-curcumene cyclase
MTRLCALLAVFLSGASLCASEPERPSLQFPKQAPTKSDEPLAEKFAPDKAAAYLDSIAVGWTRERKCGTCHTNYPYILGRAALKEESPALAEVRGFFEERITNWDRGQPGDKPRWDTEVVATAATLALHDAATTGKLHPLTRKALDRIWTVQRADGSWNWLKCDWPPMEHDDYFGAVYAAVGVGMAPEGYAKTEKAKAGLEKLRAYLKATPAPDLHHRTMLLWASTALDGLMTADEKAKTIRQLRSLQHEDGGWSLPSLGKYDRRDGTPNDPQAPSDGYATGFVIYVLRQAGVPASDEALQNGVKWLRSNQRASGRWFTRSLNNDKAHYITNAGTSFALLALAACDALKP